MRIGLWVVLLLQFAGCSINHPEALGIITGQYDLYNKQYHYLIDWQGKSSQTLRAILEVSKEQAVLVGVSLNGLTLFSVERTRGEMNSDKRYSASKDLRPEQLLEQLLLLQMPLASAKESLAKHWNVQSDTQSARASSIL